MVGLLVGDVFRNARRAVPARRAVVLDDESLTFAQLDRGANAAAAALDALPVGPGDRAVVWSATNLDVVVAFAACAKVGIVFVPVNPALTADEAEPIVRAARPALIIADGDRAAAARDLGSRVGATVLDLHDIVGAESDVDPRVEIDERAPHVVFFTSGSTGRPKGAVLSHRVNVLRTHPGAQFERRGPTVCMFPLFHMAGWTIAMQQWQARDTLVLVRSADAVSICRAVATHHAARLNCIPLVWRRILEHIGSQRAETNSLATLRFADTGTSATPLELLRALRAAVPAATVRVFYGSTEAGNVMTLDAADFDRKPGSVGVPSLHTTVRVSDVGELEVSGPLLFDGYFDDAGATDAALVEGWYRTGDLAEIDADGYVSIVGRRDTVIRTGGENVAPSEVEEVLRDHPAIADVAVLGVPDDDYGEIVCAVVVIASSAIPTVQSMREFAAERIAGFKLPRRIEIVEAIPRTAATGQVQRHLVADLLDR